MIGNIDQIKALMPNRQVSLTEDYVQMGKIQTWGSFRILTGMVTRESVTTALPYHLASWLPPDGARSHRGGETRG